MFGTVIIDAFKKDEVKEIADALEELCCPNDNYGWSSAGVYCFWNYYTREIYYIGLAVDLYERFLQHNGILPVDDNCCKYRHIQEYFEQYDKLGYSIFVQSPLSQPITHRNKKTYEGFEDGQFSVEDYVGDLGKAHIKQVEGILIEAYRKKHKHIPPWNRIGGSLCGQNSSTIGNYEIVKALSDIEPNPMVSRCSLRELAQNPTYERYENFLHAARTIMFSFGDSLYGAINFLRKHSIIDTYGEMLENNYFDKKLKL